LIGDRLHLERIRIACERAAVVAARGEAVFRADFILQDAAVREITVVGEAVKQLSVPLRDANPQVPWRDIAGTRDRVVHRYFDVDMDLVWHSASVELPSLRGDVLRIPVHTAADD